MHSLPPIQIGKIGKAGMTTAYFSPLILSPTLWLDAADASTIIEISGNVSQWDDKSGNGYHATQGIGAAQPVYGARTQNGRGLLDFNGSSHYMELSSGLYGTPAGDNTVFVLYLSDVAPVLTETQRLMNGTVAGNTRWGLFLDETGMSAVSNAAFSPVHMNFSHDTTAHTACLKRQGTTVTLIRDSASVNDAVGADVTVTDLETGRYPTTPALTYLDGGVGEILIFERALTTAEINQINVYLKNKWGIA